MIERIDTWLGKASKVNFKDDTLIQGWSILKEWQAVEGASGDAWVSEDGITGEHAKLITPVTRACNLAH